eukprot:6181676-Pleurochrysis_carterae.AAC.1
MIWYLRTTPKTVTLARRDATDDNTAESCAELQIRGSSSAFDARTLPLEKLRLCETIPMSYNKAGAYIFGAQVLGRYKRSAVSMELLQ